MTHSHLAEATPNDQHPARLSALSIIHSYGRRVASPSETTNLTR